VPCVPNRVLRLVLYGNHAAAALAKARLVMLDTLQVENYIFICVLVLVESSSTFGSEY
jgi:hypothetical protein